MHVIGPELGLTQPGMTIACGDSHTSTHGAFGAIAFGIGTSQVRDVLASQCLAMEPLKVRRITVNGSLRPGVYAKDVILDIIRRLGVKGGTGYAYEYGGDDVRPHDDGRADDRLQHVDRRGRARRLCQSRRDDVQYLEGRPFAPQGAAFEKAAQLVEVLASDADAAYDDVVSIDAAAIEPTVTWGINPGQSVGISEKLPSPRTMRAEESASVAEALEFMSFRGGMPIAGTKIDVAFIGSCTNGRISDLRGSRAARQGPSRRQPREGARRAGLAGGAQARRDGRARQDLHRSRLRVARRRLLDVPRDEPRPAAGAADLRLVVESQLQGPSGQPDGPHAPDEPRHGRRGCRRRRSRRRPADAPAQEIHA